MMKSGVSQVEQVLCQRSQCGIGHDSRKSTQFVTLIDFNRFGFEADGSGCLTVRCVQNASHTVLSQLWVQSEQE